MFLLSCLLSLATLVSSQSTQISFGNMDDIRRMDICREICREMENPSIELPDPSEDIERGLSEEAAIANAYWQGHCTKNFVQDLDDERIAFPDARLWRHAFIAGISGLMAQFSAYWTAHKNNPHNNECFDCDAARCSATASYTNVLSNAHKIYGCPPCDQLLLRDRILNSESEC